MRAPLDHPVTLAGHLAAYALVPLALLQAGILLARRFGYTATAPGEVVGWLGVAVALLAIPYVLRRGAHVAADALAERLPTRVRGAVETLGLLLALLFALALLRLSAPYAWSAFVTGEGSNAFSGLGQRWVPKALVLLFALLLALAATLRLARR